MKPISLLPDALVNRIAAGEVVERPASIVKELVENSIDAGASEILVELMQGGKKLIRVTDNGCGIPDSELDLAVSRHATSKISTTEDLFSVASYGFRGEALASIASVSKLQLLSRPHDAHNGFGLALDGGEVVERGAHPHAQGTTVKVQYLFYQTPARLKFLKTPETEFGHILDFLNKMALAHPQIRWDVTHDGKKVLSLPAVSDLASRLEALFGREEANHLYPFSGEHEALSMSGYFLHPNKSFSHSRHFYFFVNGRPVRDKMLHHAVLEGYRDRLMRGRYPIVVLFLNLPPEMVDVNVHPAKTEVRFSQGSVIHSLVSKTLDAALRAEPWKKELEEEFGMDPSLVRCGMPSSEVESPSQTQVSSPQSVPSFKTSKPSGPWKPDAARFGALPQVSFDSLPKEATLGKTRFSSLHLVGQWMSTYLICELGDKMVIVDQHAAHERIGFEKLRNLYQTGQIPSESLLISENFDLNPSETVMVQKLLPELEKFGFEIDFFGGNTFVTRAVPSLLKNRISVKSLLTDLAGDMLEKGSMASLQDIFHAVLARMSCHGAIRANHALTHPEMQALLTELDEYPDTSYCPHGRPVSVEVTRTEIDRWFKRIL